MNSSFQLNRWQEIPGLRQVGILLVLAAAVAIGLTAFFWSQKPAYAPLFSGLADKDAADVVDALHAAGVEYQLDPLSGAITVPEAHLREARLKLASQGLPQGTRGGIEVMEKDQGFGTSQFVENARYQHALETEIGRTISELKPVKDARVHLALPKPSPFANAHEAPSASVMLQLHPGRSLEADQIAAIIHLVASSIPDLAPTRVTVVDQNGRLLTTPDPGSDQAQSAFQFEQRRRLEANYVQRVQELLEPMMGPGRVSAQVAVDMDFAETEEAKETYAPDPAKMRSEQLSEQTTSNAAPAQGVPGATSNTPPVAGSATTATATTTAPIAASKSSTRNFELDRTLSHTHSPPGRVRRVSAAVLLDVLPVAAAATAPTPDNKSLATTGATQALDEKQLKQVEDLVKQAIGFDEKRGDSVSIMNAAFARPDNAMPDEGTPLWQQPLVHDITRVVIGSIIVLLLLFGVLRPALRNLMTPRFTGGNLPALTGPSATVEASTPNAPRNDYEEKLRLAKATTAQDPKKVAQIVKNWVNDDA
jgi:flagellar M-ring protein FliF